MCKNSKNREKERHAPCVTWIPAVLSSVCYSQEDISWSEGFPNVITHAVEPKERTQQAHVKNRVGDKETNVIAKLCEDPYEICGLTNDQTNCNCCHNVSNQISQGWQHKVNDCDHKQNDHRETMKERI